MAILSAVRAQPYPAAVGFIPSAEQTASPDYGFSFDAHHGYEEFFNLDRALDMPVSTKPKTGPPPALDFTDINLYYRRLFRLADTNAKPRLYLCPWLIVPFEVKSGGGYTVAIRNALDAPSVELIVRPFLKSQPDSVVPGATPGAATSWIKNLAPARKLTLGTTAGSPVHAKWKKTANLVIDEVLCANSQELEITFDDAVTSYPYSCDLTITNEDGLLVGQLCLVFVEMIEIPTVLFNVSNDTSNTVKITQLKQPESDMRLNGSDSKSGLNKILRRAGFRCGKSPPTQPPLPIKREGENLVTPAGTPIYFAIGESVIKKSILQPARVTSKFLNSIATIDGQNVNFSSDPLQPNNWMNSQNPFLAIFFMSYVELTEYDANMQSHGDIQGYSRFFSRVVQIFMSTPRNIAHECCHTFGLVHAFFGDKEPVADSVFSAEIQASVMGIMTQQDLYAFYDDANKRGLKEALLTKMPSGQIPTGNRFAVSIFLQNLLSSKRYAKFSTDDLMDYLHEEQTKESLRKDQIDRIRCYV